MKEKFENLTMKDLTTSHAIENMFAILAALFFIAFALVPFIENGDYADLINSVVGAISLIVALIFFLYTYSLYGYKSKEGQAWLILSSALIVVLASNVASSFGYTLFYFLLRFFSIPLLALGLIVKLWFTGIDLDFSQKIMLAITMLGWFMLILVSTFIPSFKDGFQPLLDSYAFYAVAEIIAVLFGLLVIQVIEAKGWFLVAIGMLLISMGDIFHPLAQQYGMIYPGTPLRLFWYIGLLVAGFGAYYQRKEHLKMIAI